MPPRQFLKAANRSTILNVVKTFGPIARADIAKMTGLSPAGVTGITAQLIQDGLIFEKQEGDSRGGRKPILLALDSKGAYVVGMKLAKKHATFALTDLNAEVIAKYRYELNTEDPHLVASEIAGVIRQFVRNGYIDSTRLLGVGIGLSGIVDSEKGICRISPFNTWCDVPFAAILERHLDYPVYLDNDVNTLTLYERLFGYGQKVKDFLVVTIGRGVGMGIVADGQLYRGTRGGAGEFGHINIDPEGPLCRCGNRGCLETFIGDEWLLRRAVMDGVQVYTSEELVDAARSGNLTALNIFTRAGNVLGASLATLVNLFNPELIVLSGEGIRASEFLLDPLNKALKRHSFNPLGDDVELRVETLDDDTWARGAASLVLGNVFHRPEVALVESE